MDRREDLRGLEGRLARSWRANEGPPLDRAWREDVMADVRTRASARSNRPERIARNACVAASIAALVTAMFVVVRAAAFDPSFEVARILASDPQSLLQLLLVF